MSQHIWLYSNCVWMNLWIVYLKWPKWLLRLITFSPLYIKLTKTCQKRYKTFLVNFLFGNPNSSAKINTIQNNMAIIEGNQDVLSSQIQMTFNFVNLTYTETDTDWLLLKSLQKDILHINNTVHCLLKELKALFHDRNFFIIMFQLRCYLATLQSGINSVRINILSILNQVSVISSQKLKPALLNQSDLELLLTKLENQLLSHPQLALPQWEGEDIWYMYKFMKLQSFMFSDTLYVVLHIPLVNKSLQFNLYRIHNIPVVHPVLNKSLKYSIQEKYLEASQNHSIFHSP